MSRENKIIISSNPTLFEDTINKDGDCIIHFDNGESCRWSDDKWPLAISTHFSKINIQDGAKDV